MAGAASLYNVRAYLFGRKPGKPGALAEEKRVDCGVHRVNGILKSRKGIWNSEQTEITEIKGFTSRQLEKNIFYFHQ